MPDNQIPKIQAKTNPLESPAKSCSNLNNNSFFCSMTKGMTAGLLAQFILTPVTNWSNHYMSSRPFGFNQLASRYAMKGALSYSAAAIPCYGVTFVIANETKKIDIPTPVGTFVGGFVSGLISCPFEAIAQSKQLSGLAANAVYKTIVRKNGHKALLRGSLILGLHDGIWSISYMAVPDILGAKLNNNLGINLYQSEALAAFISGGFFGWITSPLNLLRHSKHNNLTTYKIDKSYCKTVRDIWNNTPHAQSIKRCGFFFKGAAPRAATTAIGALALHEGVNAYERLLTKISEVPLLNDP